MFDQIFLSPQVKRSVIISNKDSIYELPLELPNDLRLRDQNQGVIVKSQNFIELLPNALSFSQNENFVNTSKNS